MGISLGRCVRQNARPESIGHCDMPEAGDVMEDLYNRHLEGTFLTRRLLTVRLL